ncbi:hypothetical protein EWM64_g9976 [Hericium alpestre]|uniref:Protein kinase domain-containing protein n=1 Tax=Hericium alpestre TaxID=135208 RepID=A0A4Y9ZH21_9AGAM|nr:hypothetical protein EWM64_g9976 [Hericium alpestre]
MNAPTLASILLRKDILTLDGTLRHSAGELQEREFLKKIAACENTESLPVLRDDFVLSGPRGDHLCFVMDFLSTDVSSLRRQSPTRALPVHLQLHELDIVHLDINGDNVLFGGVNDDARARLGHLAQRALSIVLPPPLAMASHSGW